MAGSKIATAHMHGMKGLVDLDRITQAYREFLRKETPIEHRCATGRVRYVM